MVAPPPPLCEPPFISYQLKATVGYQYGPGADTSGIYRPPWTNACAASGGDFRRGPGGGIGPLRPALPAGHGFPLPAIGPFRCPAADLGAALAGTGPVGGHAPRRR